jgi:hypothetical protein
MQDTKVIFKKFGFSAYFGSVNWTALGNVNGRMLYTLNGKIDFHVKARKIGLA